MIKNNNREKAGLLDCKTDYHFIRDFLTNPYTCSLGKCERDNIGSYDKMHRFTKR